MNIGDKEWNRPRWRWLREIVFAVAALWLWRWRIHQ